MPTQNNPWSQQLPQPQNMATHISPDNPWPVVEQTTHRQNSDSGTLSTNLPGQVQVLNLNKDPNHCQQNSNQQQQTRQSSTVKTRKSNCSKFFSNYAEDAT